MTKERQAELIHDACRECGLDGHVSWLRSYKDAVNGAEKLCFSPFDRESVPIKKSFMYCDSLDMCFFYDQTGHACVSYSGRSTLIQPDMKDNKLVEAFEIAKKVLTKMQELADKE